MILHSSSSHRKKLTLIDADGLAAGVAVFGKHRVEAMQAIGSAVPHDVPLAAQTSVALEASKVLHVPSPAFSLRALVRKYDLKDKTSQNLVLYIVYVQSKKVFIILFMYFDLQNLKSVFVVRHWKMLIIIIIINGYSNNSYKRQVKVGL